MLRLDGLLLGREGFRLAADWAVPEGARVALLGPSGGGKSTLIDAVAGFLAPLAGRVLWRGADLGPLAPGDRPVGVLFQDGNLFPHLTVAQNAGLALRPGPRLRPEERGRVEAALSRVGLGGLGERRPAGLSGGQAARAALARVLLQGRPLVLLDEPFGALGPAQRAGMLDLTLEALPEATLLLVTHDPGEARRLGGLAAVVAGGVAEAPRPVAAVLDDPPPALRAYLSRG